MLWNMVREEIAAVQPWDEYRMSSLQRFDEGTHGM
jgi:hypothetical protein